MRLILLTLALLLLAGCVTYPGPYDYDDPYYQSSGGYSGVYDEQYYEQEQYSYGRGYAGAYDVTHSYDPWFSLYWGWDYYGYAPYRHNYYSGRYRYDPFYRPYYGYGWSAWDYLWWPSARYYGHRYYVPSYFGGWYGSGYYWRPYVHRRDDRDHHRSPRQAARDVRSEIGVPSTHSSRPAGRGPTYQGQGYGQGYGQTYGPAYRGQAGTSSAPQGSGNLRSTVRDLNRSGDSRRAPGSYGQPTNRGPANSTRDALRTSPGRPVERGRSTSNVPTTRSRYQDERRTDPSPAARSYGQPSRSRDAVRQSTPNVRPSYPASNQQRAPRSRSSESYRAPPANVQQRAPRSQSRGSYQAPAAPPASTPQRAPRSQSTETYRAPSAPQVRSTAPASRASASGRSTRAVRGRQED